MAFGFPQIAGLTFFLNQLSQGIQNLFGGQGQSQGQTGGRGRAHPSSATVAGRPRSGSPGTTRFPGATRIQDPVHTGPSQFLPGRPAPPRAERAPPERQPRTEEMGTILPGDPLFPALGILEDIVRSNPAQAGNLYAGLGIDLNKGGFGIALKEVLAERYNFALTAAFGDPELAAQIMKAQLEDLLSIAPGVSGIDPGAPPVSFDPAAFAQQAIENLGLEPTTPGSEIAPLDMSQFVINPSLQFSSPTSTEDFF